MGDSLPQGFLRFRGTNADVVCREELAPAIRDVLGAGSLYEYGARHSLARRFSGRGVVYAVPLPSGDPVVIRHNRRGGAFAPITRDLYLPPTLAERELRTSERLRHAGIATPEIVAYAVYRAAVIFRRADVMTREVPDAFDLAVALMSDDAELRARALGTTAGVVRALSAEGAHHPDLNIKNVLLHAPPGTELTGYILDVDRISFEGDRASALERNVARLLRSARKWQVEYGARVTSRELAELDAACRDESRQLVR